MRKSTIKFFVKKTAKIIGIILLLAVLSLAIMPFTSNISRTGGDEITTVSADTMLISAHRAGGSLAPENTMYAMELCLETTDYFVDILEFDLHMTADGKLIVLHDDTFDRTSDVELIYGEEILVSELTYEELLVLNVGYDFVDEDGNYPYREEGADLSKVRVVLLEEVLEYVESYCTANNRTIEYVIEIKDGDELGERAADELYRIMNEYDTLDRTAVGTFEGNVTAYLDEAYPDITRSAGVTEFLTFYMCFLYNVDLSNVTLNYSKIMAPYDQYVINFGTAAFIDYAHKYGIEMQYWTINDPEKVLELYENGADVVMTDDPQMAYDVVYN
ncbi:MAG: glycerophosphodiester phosphodiesterase family protein [Bacillota bacterium]